MTGANASESGGGGNPQALSCSVANHNQTTSWVCPARVALFFLDNLCHLRRSVRGEAQTAEGHSMTFDDMLAQVLELLQREKRVSYRALKRRFGLNDDDLEDVKDELIYAKKLAVDEEHRVLVWVGEQE